MTLTAHPPRQLLDDELRAFLTARIVEEREAARRHPRRVRGMELLDEVLRDLRDGSAPDQMTCDLLLVAYARHPEFQERWNRWRPSAEGFVAPAAREAARA